MERAAQRLGVPAGDLTVEDGVVRVKAAPERSVSYGALIGDGVKLDVDAKIELKKAPDYKVIGKSIRRVDIPAKVTGEFTYVHDVRVPGMLHARVIRPDDLGARIASVDDSAARQVSGFVQTVRKGDFLAVVARNEWAAIKAARAVRVTWTAGTGLPEQATVFETWRKLPVAKEEVTQNVGDAKAALDTSAQARQGDLRFCGADPRDDRPVMRGRGFPGRQADGVDVVAGDPLDAARVVVDHGPAARSDPPRLHRRRGLLRPQRHGRCGRGCRADLDHHRSAGARAMVARGRDRALAEKSAAHDGYGGGTRRAG